ncbi:hypothetical protein MHI40_13730 [Psychrobacillus sp. FSL H8-0510]
MDPTTLTLDAAKIEPLITEKLLLSLVFTHLEIHVMSNKFN